MKTALTTAVVALSLVSSAHAQSDHLECFTVRDSEQKARYTARLENLAPPHGCVVKLPAKLMCVPTAEPVISPAPPGAARGRSTGAFLCYKIRCRRGALAPLTVNDRFGQRIVKPRRSRLLCAPVPGSNDEAETCATTTTTTLVDAGGSSTTTTSIRRGSTTTVIPHSTTTTTLPQPQCTQPNTACGSCGDGLCQPIRPTGELICAYQNQAFCAGACTSTADCPEDQFCVGGAGDAHCCTPCP
jgi:hypothetical protein